MLLIYQITVGVFFGLLLRDWIRNLPAEMREHRTRSRALKQLTTYAGLSNEDKQKARSEGWFPDRDKVLRMEEARRIEEANRW